MPSPCSNEVASRMAADGFSQELLDGWVQTGRALEDCSGVIDGLSIAFEICCWSFRELATVEKIVPNILDDAKQ